MEQEKNKKESCPLCSVSEESLERLKKRGEEKRTQKDKTAIKKRGFFRKIWGK